MKKVLLGVLFVGLLVPTFAFAADFRSGSSQSLSSSEVVTDDLYLFGGTIVDSGVVHGDFIAAGGTILVSGPVDGTVQVAGGNIALSSSVGKTVRAAGGSVVINSDVGSDVVVAGGTVEVDGKVGRDVLASGGTVSINAQIAGRVEITAQKIIIGSSTVIAGPLTYHSPTKADIDPNAKILGAVTYVPTDVPSDKDAKAALVAFFTFWIIAKFLMMLVAALLLVWLLNRYVLEVVTHAFQNPPMEFVKGVAAIILFPIVSLLLCVTVLGLPLGILGFLSYFALLILSTLIAPLLLGSLIFKWTMKTTHYEVTWKTALLGVVVYEVVSLIPLVGWLVGFVFVPLALGVILKVKWNIIKTMR